MLKDRRNNYFNLNLLGRDRNEISKGTHRVAGDGGSLITPQPLFSVLNPCELAPRINRLMRLCRCCTCRPGFKLFSGVVGYTRSNSDTGLRGVVHVAGRGKAVQCDAVHYGNTQLG